MMSWREVHDLSELTTTSTAAGGDAEETKTPMRMARVVTLDDAGDRITLDMRWGFPGARATDPVREPPRHMHAKGETVDALPTFTEAFATHRGFLIVKDFNVGEELPNKKVKQWTLRDPADRPLALAVIWERWVNEKLGTDFLAFVMVTTEANPLIAPKTDRMPFVIPPDDIPLWLGEQSAPLSDVKSIIRPYGGELVMTEQKKQPPPPKPKPAKRAPQPTLF